MGRQNPSGGVFEAGCSKQMGQRKKTIFHQKFLCLQTKVRVSDADRNVLLEYKVERDRIDIEGLFQRQN